MKCVALARKAVHPVGSPPSPEATRRASLPKGWPMTEAVLAHVKPPPRQRWRATSTEMVSLSCEMRHGQGHRLRTKGLHVLVVYACRPTCPA